MERIVDYGDLDDFGLLHYKEDFQSPHPLHAYYLDVLFNELTVVISLYNEVDVEAISNLTNSEIKAPFDRVTKFIKKVVTSDPKDVAESGSDLCGQRSWRATIFPVPVRYKQCFHLRL